MALKWIQGGFNAKDVSAGALAETSLKATPGSGLSHYITDIIIVGGGTLRTWQIRDGSAAVFSYACPINTSVAIGLKVPIKVGADKPITVTNGGASTGSAIYINGFTDRG